jgi:histone-lysine N-methyltransferase SETMAR
MLTVLGNTDGFHVVDLLSKGATFNTDYYFQDILSEILWACPACSNRRLTAGADNTRLYVESATRVYGRNSLRKAPHLPFSPDLAPSDFFLFGSIDGKLQGTEFMEKGDLLGEIREILNGIPGKI